MYTKKNCGEFTLYKNEGGAVLGMKRARVVEQDGFVFKDLAKCGKLLPYEDWRLAPRTRAEDLASRLTAEEIAGLMLYSSHQLVPFRNMGPFQAHYDGKTYEEGKTEKWALTDEQKKLICEDNIRHILMMKAEDAYTAARWSNALQALAEEQPFGIPVNISSDPRHGAGDAGAEYKSAGQDVSKWPEGIGMTATFSEELWKKYAKAVSEEYRAMGITTALGPQVDLATEPRWMRYEDTFGGDLETSVRMAKVICDGMQTTEGAPDGWGKDSIVAMAKHWPGGGTGEGGRDAHYPFGQFAVYPDGGFDKHKKVFTEGAFALDGPTGYAAAVMPYYTVSWGQDKKNGENVGNSYSEYIIRDLLRGKYGYEGVICTDWGITGAPEPAIDSFGSRCYGTADLTEGEQHLRILMNGVDQFGGNDAKAPVLEAYRLGCERYGEKPMRARFEESAVRLLTNIFRLGLFENPYVDPEMSSRIVGAPEFVAAGKAAQRASVVLLKNKAGCLPLQPGIRVYIPERKIRARKNFFRTMDPERAIDPLSKAEMEAVGMIWAEDGTKAGSDQTARSCKETVGRESPAHPETGDSAKAGAGMSHADKKPRGVSEAAGAPDRAGTFRAAGNVSNAPEFDGSSILCRRVGRPEDADAALIFIESPLSDPYSTEDLEKGGNGYLPISLQYRPYTAVNARKESIAGGDFREPSPNRSYCGKTNTTANEADLDLVLETRKAMKGKPVIVCMRVHNPLVVAEFEKSADGILAEFGVQKDAVLDILFGKVSPTGRLPMTLSADMDTVERHCEDSAEDIVPYTDGEQNVYRFGFGLHY